MAGSTFQPPIHLDPNQDSGQQTAFINQNFQSLAAVLESSSFRVINSNTVQLVKPALMATAELDIPHNLPYTPIILAFANSGVDTASIQVPFTNVLTTGTNSGKSNVSIVWFTDDTNITFNIGTPDFTGNTFYTFSFTYNITYYILQLSTT